MTPRAIVAAGIEDETVSTRAEDGVLSTEVTGPAERLQVRGPDAESNPRGSMPPADLLDNSVYFRADGGKHRQQFFVTGCRLTELRDDVHRRAHPLMTDDPRHHTPRVVAENPSADSLTRHERQALGVETFHDRASLPNEPAVSNRTPQRDPSDRWLPIREHSVMPRGARCHADERAFDGEASH